MIFNIGQIIKNSLKDFLNKKLESDAMKRIISDAQFSFKMVLEICLSMAKNENAEAHSYFNKFLDFIIESYLILGNSENYKEADLETMVKVYELNTYIKNSFIEKLLISYAQALGTKEIIRMINENKNMKSLRFKDYRGIIQFLGFERKIMKDIDYVCRSGHRENKEEYFAKKVSHTAPHHSTTPNTISSAEEESKATDAQSPKNALKETQSSSTAATLQTYSLPKLNASIQRTSSVIDALRRNTLVSFL